MDFALVSLNLTASSLEANCSEYRTQSRLQRQFYLAHEPMQYTVSPATTKSRPPTQHFPRMKQNISCLVSMRSFQCDAGSNG